MTAGRLLPSTWETPEKSPAGQALPQAPSAQGSIRTRTRLWLAPKGLEQHPSPDTVSNRVVLIKQNLSLP